MGSLGYETLAQMGNGEERRERGKKSIDMGRLSVSVNLGISVCTNAWVLACVSLCDCPHVVCFAGMYVCAALWILCTCLCGVPV